ncbi:hypothetical protein M2168_005378 [Streptomyces sp. CZ24]|nr:hypothetical protein [Streptomyces sp. CZ24]
MLHLLRHSLARVQLGAGESILSGATWLGHKRGLAAMDTWLA